MREDILKELELLPVWQLRQPPQQMRETVLAKTDHPEAIAAVEPKATALESAEHAPTQAVICYTNANNGFVLLHAADNMTSMQQQLLQNIVSSLPFNLMKEKTQQTAGEVVQNQTPKTLLLMGEALAQQVLNVSDALSTLRGNIAMLDEVQVVTTFELNQVLGEVEIKKQLWQDCCLALSTLSDD